MTSNSYLNIDFFPHEGKSKDLENQSQIPLDCLRNKTKGSCGVDELGGLFSHMMQ